MGGNTSQHQVLSSHRTSSRKGCQFTAALRSAAEMSRKCMSSKASSFWLLCPHFPPEEGPEVGITERLPFPWATEAPTAFSLAPFELGRLCEHLPEGAAEGPTRPTARRSECASPSLCPVDVCSPASLSPSPPPSAPRPRLPPPEGTRGGRVRAEKPAPRKAPAPVPVCTWGGLRAPGVVQPSLH